MRMTFHAARQKILQELIVELRLTPKINPKAYLRLPQATALAKAWRKLPSRAHPRTLSVLPKIPILAHRERTVHRRDAGIAGIRKENI